MPQELNRVRVEGVDWRSLLPFTHIFSAFRLSLHPTKLMLGLLLAVLLYLGGLGLDMMWGPRVHSREIEAYQAQPVGDYHEWREARDQVVHQAISSGGADPRAGVFETLLAQELEAFDQFINSALGLQFGVRAFLVDGDSTGVIGAIKQMAIVLPGWLYSTYPAFMAVYLLGTFLVLAILGGAITRHAGLQACSGEGGSLIDSVTFAARKYVMFVCCPVIPLLLALVLGLLLIALPGLLFNVPGLDMLGGLLFGLLLAVGFVIALLLIGLFAGSGLMFPALAVEGTDAFDAVSRAYGYVFGRPGRFLFYTAVMMVFGALCYLLVGMVVFLTLWATKVFAGLLVFGQVDEAGRAWFDTVLPDPRLGELVPKQQGAQDLGWTRRATGWMVIVWVKLLMLMLPAFAVSYFFSAQTWVYLLLRKSADGSSYDEVYVEPTPQQIAEATPDKIEPNDPAPATSGQGQDQTPSGGGVGEGA